METEEIIEKIESEMVCANACPQYKSGHYIIHLCDCYKRDAIESVGEQVNVFAVVKRLVGEIDPVGETHTDNRRFENLEVMVELMDDIHTDLDRVLYENKNHKEGSIVKACKYINAFFTRIGIPEE